MFGDAGHGIILTVFSTYMVIYEQQLSKTKSSNEVNRKYAIIYVISIYFYNENMNINTKFSSLIIYYMI